MVWWLQFSKYLENLPFSIRYWRCFLEVNGMMVGSAKGSRVGSRLVLVLSLLNVWRQTEVFLEYVEHFKNPCYLTSRSICLTDGEKIQQQGWPIFVLRTWTTSKATSTSIHECRMRHAEMRKMLMWMCSQVAVNNIRLCGEHSVNSLTLSVWSRYFKEKYVRNVGHTFN